MMICNMDTYSTIKILSSTCFTYVTLHSTVRGMQPTTVTTAIQTI